MTQSRARSVSAAVREGMGAGALAALPLGLWALGRTLPFNSLGLGQALLLGLTLALVYGLAGAGLGGLGGAMAWLLGRRRTATWPVAAATVLAAAGALAVRGRVDLLSSDGSALAIGAGLGLALGALLGRVGRRRGRSLAGSILALELIALVAIAYGLSTTSVSGTSAGREGLREGRARSLPLLIVGLDGVDPEILDALIDEGQLPTLGGLRAEGAYSSLESMQPTWSPPLWTSIWTGKLPEEHGILYFLADGTYRIPGTQTDLVLPRLLGLQRAADVVLESLEIPVTSELRRATAVWEVLGLAEGQAVLANRLVSWPALPLSGVELSSRLLLEEPAIPELAYPPEMVDIALERLASAPPYFDPGLDAAPWLARGISKEGALWNLAAEEAAERGADLLILYTHLIDSAQHRYLKYHWPERFEFDCDPERLRIFGGAIAATYRGVDAMLASVLQRWSQVERVLVISDHGVEPNAQLERDEAEAVGALSMPPAPVEEVSGVHGSAPPGIFLLWGRGVRSGPLPRDPSVLDIAPLALHLLGLPIAEDMQRSSFLEEDPELVQSAGPALRVSTYEGLLPRRVRAMESSVDARIKDELRALGYIE